MNYEQFLNERARLAAEMQAEADRLRSEREDSYDAFRRAAEQAARGLGGFADAFRNSSWGFDAGSFYGSRPTASPGGRQRHLKALGLSSGFTADELKRAYRKRVRETHPDVGGDPEEFRRIQAAYEALK